MAEIHSDIQKLTAVKVNEEKYTTDLAFFRDEHLKLRYAVEDFHHRLDTTDNFIEKYVPLRIQSQISETMVAVMGRREKKKLFDDDYTEYVNCSENLLYDSDNNWDHASPQPDTNQEYGPSKPDSKWDHVPQEPDTNWNQVQNEPITNWDQVPPNPDTGWDRMQNKPDRNWNIRSSERKIDWNKDTNWNNESFVPYTDSGHASYRLDNNWNHRPRGSYNHWDQDQPVTNKSLSSRQSSHDYETPVKTTQPDDYESMAPIQTHQRQTPRSQKATCRALEVKPR